MTRLQFELTMAKADLEHVLTQLEESVKRVCRFTQELADASTRLADLTCFVNNLTNAANEVGILNTKEAMLRERVRLLTRLATDGKEGNSSTDG
jgi:predicted  nucleic acid-binding Zn-ribbon protein